MWSVSLVISECSLSGHGQGHKSNFYIVDLENFATASRRYTGDIHNSSVVGLFMTPIGQQEWLVCTMVECTFLFFDLLRTCRTSSFCTVAWQLARFQLTQRISRSAIAELLCYVLISCWFHNCTRSSQLNRQLPAFCWTYSYWSMQFFAQNLLFHLSGFGVFMCIVWNLNYF